MDDISNELEQIIDLPKSDRLLALLEHGRSISLRNINGAERNTVIEELVLLLNDGAGTGHQRRDLGVVLGRLGDPRLRRPNHDNYWVDVRMDHGNSIQVGRSLVSTAEFQAWIDEGGYDDESNWTDSGIQWKRSGQSTWSDLATDPEVAHLVIPNHPVVGVNWYEAAAYANAHGARLASNAERRWIVRGAEKRPYPWGQPFGDGNSNTREESLGQPCAVGLFLQDRTPDGVWDLAGNAAEWLRDGSDERRMLHPGSWVRPSMASWAKALELSAPDTRSADLGFRLTRDC